MGVAARLLLVVLLCFVLPRGLMGQTANFIADDTAGCAPLVVHFTNTSVCPGCTYTWNLGNSTTSTLTHVSGSYVTPGTYTVTLTADSMSAIRVKTRVITVYPQPVVAFSANDTSVCPGVPVVFTSTSTGGVPGPLTYGWNFGDGDSSTLASPAHPYVNPGFYNITLSVTNARGCTEARTLMGYQHVFTKPVPVFTATPVSVCSAPATISFTNSTTGTAPLSYVWHYGDATTSTATAPPHTYAAPGTYTVKLIATNGNGCKDSLARSNYIRVSGLNGTFTGPSATCQHSQVTFTNTSTPHAWSSWNFGDGNVSTAESPVHTYTTAGTYTVTLVVSDGPCFSTRTQAITVNPVPVFTYTITPQLPCPAPVLMTFTATTVPAATVVWKYSSTDSSVGNPATHLYTESEIYTVTATATTAAGCKTVLEKEHTIFTAGLIVSAGPLRGCAPHEAHFQADPVTFTGVSSPVPYPYRPFSYVWTFGDGSPSVTDSTPDHTYIDTGIYTATVTATTGNGCVMTRQVNIEVRRPPEATFVASRTQVCYGDTITFIPTVISGAVDTFEWDFGSEKRYTPGPVIFRYTGPDTFTVKMKAFYHGCADSAFEREDYIIVDSPKAIIGKGFPCVPRTSVQFGDSSLGDTYHVWIFGDGDTSLLPHPLHNYPALDTYAITLATYNSRSGCRDTARGSVILMDVNTYFTADDTAVCEEDVVTFTSVIDSGAVYTYSWYVGDSAKPWAVYQNYTDTFWQRGIYDISFVTTDMNGCLDTAVRHGYQHVGKPDVRFGSLRVGCAPLLTEFIDSTTDIPGAALINFAWSFGDGAFDTVNVPTVAHTYTAAGTYPVELTVTDNIGCKDTLRVADYIEVHRPFAFFYADNTHPCPGNTVSFTNMTTGTTQLLWYFGDGDSSYAAAPAHVYASEGMYTVKLMVVDSFGCTDTAIYANYVIVAAPHASFTASDTFAVCPPLTVNFTNTTTGATNHSWTFGDGNLSIVPSPSNIYGTAGLRTVRLIATNAYGCRDTAVGQVRVYGYAGAFTYSPVNGCSPLSVRFEAALTNVPNMTWDFADGVTVATTEDTISHVYTTPGAYVPKLILSDNTGCENYSMGLDTIKVGRVAAHFKTLPAKACAGVAINFVDSSSSRWASVTAWGWSYDGTTSTLTSPSHAYTAAGTYSVTLTATDGWGCSGSVTKVVTINPLPAIVSSTDTVLCGVGAIAKLYATGGATYVWGSGSTLSCTACDTAYATPLVNTTYTVTGTDTNGCVSSDTVRVSLLPGIAPQPAICPGATLTVSNTAPGGTWSSANIAVANVAAATGVVTGMAPGTAEIMYTLPSGCFASVVITINTTPKPIDGTGALCTGATVSLSDTVVGGTWISANGGVATIDTNTGMVSGIAAGTSVITYALANGCYITGVMTVNAYPPAITGRLRYCEGSTDTLSNAVTGGSWSSGTAAVATVDTAGRVWTTSAGTTTITYDPGTGCIVTTAVTVYATPEPGVITGADTFCAGSTVTLSNTTTGGTWRSNRDTVAIVTNAGIVTGLKAGSSIISYETDTNAAGCSSRSFFTIVVTEPTLTIAATTTDVQCYGGHDGRIAVAVDSGIAPYEYQWTHGGSGITTDSLVAGTYIITVTETVTQCRKADTFTVVQPDTMIVTSSLMPDSCFKGTGSIRVDVIGGVAPYQYAWFNNATGNEVTGLMPGTYTMTVTDMHGCARALSEVVAEDSCLGITVHDIITPNGDGFNDVWVIEGLELYPANTVQVFDKWGDMVYERSNYNNDWQGQGMKNGAVLPDGTYYYLVKLNAENRGGGPTIFKGAVMIKR
ncbi:MAG: PKD domain-containing protein [Bacteroidota bacterium]